MRSFLVLGAALLGLSPFVSGTPLRAEPLDVSPAPALVKKQDCVNTPTTRDCWTPGFDADTDMYSSWPTGQTRQYTLTLTNTTCNPDGAQSRVCLLINGAMPGPTIIGNWGELFARTLTSSF